ncbi:pilus assembly protein [Georgenia phoenicis]|uniref:pilus assembly protein n=1 Tax=unclassified Georgenia TaxID=2626815 RepID=UPI0039B0DAEF
MTGVQRVLRRLRDDEGGNAVVEFIGVTLVLLVPLVYLVLTLGQIQAAVFAAEAAARESGRALSRAEDLETAVGQAQTSVALAFEDHGIDIDPVAALDFTCSDDPCLSAGAQIHVEVATSVQLPLVPDFLAGAFPLEVPVRATHLAAVPEFGGLP